jgi:hypothetical protein
MLGGRTKLRPYNNKLLAASLCAATSLPCLSCLHQHTCLTLRLGYPGGKSSRSDEKWKGGNNQSPTSGSADLLAGGSSHICSVFLCS